MGKIRFNVSISLDGYMAGPDQSEENPLGAGGMKLHNWLFDLEAWRESHGESGGRVDASTPVVQELETGFGSVVMGRNMFGPTRGEWGADPWRGWCPRAARPRPRAPRQRDGTAARARPVLA